VFSYYTGLSYADVAKLTKNDIAIGIDGSKWVFTFRTKTDTKSHIPLLPKTLEILDKYAQAHNLQASGKLLSVISNQRMNSY
jgi:hypothetical protein